MSELKCTKKEYFSVNYDDVDKIINKYYFPNATGRDDKFSCIAAEEMGNDSIFDFELDGVLEDYDKEEIDDREQGFGMVSNYLNDLARQGIIDKGNYIVNICW